MSQKTSSVREAAKQLGCTLKYIYDLLYSARLPGEKVGREWRIPVEALKDRLRHRAGGK
jgi:excisionase family DNA binding protein